MIWFLVGLVVGLGLMYLYARNSPKHFINTQAYIDAIADKYGMKSQKSAKKGGG